MIESIHDKNSDTTIEGIRGKNINTTIESSPSNHKALSSSMSCPLTTPSMKKGSGFLLATPEGVLGEQHREA